MIFPATSENIERASQCLKQGGLVGLPTETVYGLGADARNVDAVKRIFAAKNRPTTHPLIVHLADFEQFSDWAFHIPESAKLLVSHFCPAPLTIILKKQPSVPLEVTGGQDTVALRIPNHPVALELLKKFDSGIAAPSANRFCKISPTQAQHVIDELGNSVEMVLDGGACRIGVESTIIDLSGAKPTLLRYGQITRSELARVLETDIVIPDNLQQITVRTAGMMAIHYAPNTQAICCQSEELDAAIKKYESAKIGILTLQPIPQSENVIVIQMSANAESYAQSLYAKLRELDNLNLDVILVEQPPNTEIWQAVNDRLTKATKPL